MYSASPPCRNNWKVYLRAHAPYVLASADPVHSDVRGLLPSRSHTYLRAKTWRVVEKKKNEGEEEEVLFFSSNARVITANSRTNSRNNVFGSIWTLDIMLLHIIFCRNRRGRATDVLQCAQRVDVVYITNLRHNIPGRRINPLRTAPSSDKKIAIGRTRATFCSVVVANNDPAGPGSLTRRMTNDGEIACDLCTYAMRRRDVSTWQSPTRPLDRLIVLRANNRGLCSAISNYVYVTYRVFPFDTLHSYFPGELDIYFCFCFKSPQVYCYTFFCEKIKFCLLFF